MTPSITYVAVYSDVHGAVTIASTLPPDTLDRRKLTSGEVMVQGFLQFAAKNGISTTASARHVSALQAALNLSGFDDVPAAQAAPQPAIQQGDDAAALNEIADIFQIGSKARKDRWCILENVRTSFRREQCLSRIEHSYFTVPRPPEGGDEEDEGGGGEECLLNWGDEPDEYAKRFGEALAQIAEPTPATQRDARLWCVHIHGPDEVHAMPSRAAALERANDLNEIFGQHPHEEGDPIMRAVVIEWSHSANAHKQDLADAARTAKHAAKEGAST